MPIQIRRRSMLAALVLSAASAAHAGTYTVTTTADNGPGSLRQILADLPAGEANEIRFQPGGSGIVALAVASDLPPLRGTSVLVDGQYTMGGIAIDGQGTSRLFVTNGMPTTFRNITIRNGAGGLNAGCVQVSGSVSLDNVVIEGCRSGINSGNAYGGGLSGFGTLTVRRSQFRDNVARSGTGGGNQSGGAIYYSGDLLVEDSLFEDNRAEEGPNFFSDGGGITMADGVLTVRRSRFIGNSVAAPANGSASGGGIVCNRSDCLVEASYFGENASVHGGAAIMALGSHLTLRNVVVQGNVGGRGGAVVVRGLETHPVTATIENSTFTDNGNLGWTGYGVHLDLMFEASVARISNSVFGAMQGGAGPACALSFGAVGYAGPGHNRAVDASCDALLGSDSAIATPAEMGLGHPVFGGYIEVPQLSPASVLIDAGSPAPPDSAAGACLAVDANGQPRPRDGDGDGIARCDIGAQEYERPFHFRDGFED